MEVTCSEVDCIHNDGHHMCCLEILTIGTRGSCEDFEEED